MKINRKLGILLAAPFVLLTLSATNVNADSVQTHNAQLSVQSAAAQPGNVATNARQQSVANSSADTSSIIASDGNTLSKAVKASAASANNSQASVATSPATNSKMMQSSASSASAVSSNLSEGSNSQAASSSAGNINVLNARTQAAFNVSQLYPSLYVTNYTQTQVANATYIYNYFINQGWTAQSIAGVLGNMVSESGLNPNIWEIGGGGGYGLVQWTPATSMINWCNSNGYNYTTLAGQCAYLQYEMTHGIGFYPSSYSSMTAYQYMHSTMSPYSLALVFLANFERPANRNQPSRGQQAQYWYQYFQNNGSTTTITPVQPSSSSSQQMSQYGTFRVAYGLNVRDAPSTSATTVAYYNGGQSFTYDTKVEANGYLWASYVSYSGARRYVAMKNLSNGTTYGNDSNNFSFNGTPATTPSQPSTPSSSSTTSNTENQNGTFTASYNINIRQAPSTSATIYATCYPGLSLNYDTKIEADGYLWISYVSYSGARRYVAIKNLSTGATFGNDSNNFSFNGTSTTSTGSQSTTITMPQGNKAQQVVAIARQQLGKPYQGGATGPNSFDCSGLVQYVYNQVGISLPRTTYQQEYSGYAVSLSNLQPGDLLFWGNYGSAYHVAIYTGNGNMLFAPQPGQNVKEEPISWWMPSFARRVL